MSEHSKADYEYQNAVATVTSVARREKINRGYIGFASRSAELEMHQKNEIGFGHG